MLVVMVVVVVVVVVVVDARGAPAGPLSSPVGSSDQSPTTNSWNLRADDRRDVRCVHGCVLAGSALCALVVVVGCHVP